MPREQEVGELLFIGDDWAEEHHDIELVDDEGRVLARRRLPEGIEGVARLHALVAEQLGDEELEPERVRELVKVGIETDRGPWVAALVAAGHEVFAINPLSVARYRERHSTSRAKSDLADAHLLAEIVRVDRAHHRCLAGDSEEVEAIKLVARYHQTLVWERTRHLLRLRAALREFFPAALAAFDDLDAPDTLELLTLAPDPARAARLTRRQITAALRRARRRDIDAKTSAIQRALHTEDLSRSDPVQGAYAAVVASQAAVLAALNTQIEALGEVVEAHFGVHPDAEI
jgi:transposase